MQPPHFEPLRSDPVFRWAHKAAEHLLTGRHTRIDGHVDEARNVLSTFRSPEMRLRHFEALRVELNDLFKTHQATCSNPRCRMEEIYGDVVSVLQDEFYSLAPLIAGRDVAESMTRDEVDQLFLIIDPATFRLDLEVECFCFAA